MMHRFVYLKTAVSLVLVFIGVKVITAEVMGLEKVPAAISLGVIVALLGGGLLLSFWHTRRAPVPVQALPTVVDPQ